MTQDALPAGWPAMSIAEANALITAPGSAAEVEEVVIRGIKTKTWKNLPPTLRSVVEENRERLAESEAAKIKLEGALARLEAVV